MIQGALRSNTEPDDAYHPPHTVVSRLSPVCTQSESADSILQDERHGRFHHLGLVFSKGKQGKLREKVTARRNGSISFGPEAKPSQNGGSACLDHAARGGAIGVW